MRLLYWVTALAVLSIASGKNSTAKAKPKRQLDNIRTPQNLQYSLVLPHSRVQHFRALTNNRRISHGSIKGRLPPYAVQMEPVVQYSPKDPLYDPKQDNLDDSVVNKNEIYAQSKILHIQDDSLEGYGPPYGTLPTAPLYSHEPHPHYYEAPEPIIEIIIKESNESLPAPPPPPVQKKKKEPVHVFYVKYSKDPHSKDKVIYEKPIPAITPPTNEEDDREHEHEHNSYVTVTPEPYIPRETTTLRAIIKPESEVYHSDSSVKISFGSEGRHYSDRREGHNTYNSEDHEETAPKPAIVHPNQPLEPTLPSYPQLERSASPKSPQTFDSNPRPIFSQLHPQPSYQPPHPQPSHQLPHPQPSHQPPHPQPSHIYRSAPIHAQSRIQFQPQPTPNEQQLPRQGPSVSPFRPQVQPLSPRIPFAPTASFNPPFSNGPVGPITQFGGPTPQAPSGSPFPTAFPRTNNGQTFNSRNNQQNFASRQQFNGPPKVSFHSGPQRPFAAQSKPYFDDPKYLQENYHTITADLIDQPKRPLLPNRPLQSFGPLSQPNPSASTGQFQDHRRPSPVLPQNQQLPQQRPPQQFIESGHSPTINPGPSSSPFFNLKPSPPHIESNRPPFQQHPLQPQPQQQFGFHQGPQILPRPTSSVPLQQQYSFSASPSPIPHNQFVPQPSSTPLFNFRPQPSPTPEVFRPQSPSERPQFHQHGPSERPQLQQHGPSERPFNQHLQNFGSLVPNGGELVASVPKYEQHITVNGPTAQPFSNLGESSPSQPSPTPSQQEQIYQHQFQQQQIHKQQQQQQQHQQHQQQQHQQHQQQQQQLQQQQQQQHQQQQHQQQHQQQQQQQQQEHQQQQQHQQQILHQQQQQYHDDHVRLQLAQNVQKQQEEIQRLQAQLLDTQQQQQVHQQQIQDNYQQQFQATSPRSQYIQERSRPQHPFPSSTSSPPYYQTSRTVEIKPTTQKYVSSTQNSVSSTAEPQKEEKPHKKPAFELPDEVPDDLRQQLLSSGILDNADISVLDYDKVGETPLESLPPDQLANFFGAGGGQQIASTENRPVYVQSNGDQIESRIDEDISEDSDDQDLAASENVPSYVAPPSKDQTVEMKVVHFDPATLEGQNLAKEYIQENATQVDPVALNDKRYNRYLPLKVSGNQFPLPDILKGRKVASVVVLAPVETEALTSHSRKERATTKEDLKGIRFIAGESLQELLKRPTKDNFIKWLDVEKKTETDLQSVVLLVTGDGDATDEKEIFMYDIASGKVNKISGDLSNAFVEAAENNSLSQDFESLAIEGEGVPESFDKETKDIVAAGSDNVPLFVDLSGLSLDQKNVNQVSISSSYSKTKLGRSFRRH